jgi:hypothetical protein
MAKEWLNVFVDQSGSSPASQWVTATDVVKVNGATLRLWESDRSGAVTMNRNDVAAYGDAEVFLTIAYQNGSSRFLSAPLHTPVDVSGVASLTLTILFLTGPPGTSYTALVNGHCVYEVL